MRSGSRCRSVVSSLPAKASEPKTRKKLANLLRTAPSVDGSLSYSSNASGSCQWQRGCLSATQAQMH